MMWMTVKKLIFIYKKEKSKTVAVLITFNVCICRFYFNLD